MLPAGYPDPEAMRKARIAAALARTSPAAAAAYEAAETRRSATVEAAAAGPKLPFPEHDK